MFLNLCELLSSKKLKEKNVNDFINSILRGLGDPVLERLYLGSSFCSQFFLNTTGVIKQALEEVDIPVTLTLPIFSQKDLKSAKEEILRFFEYKNIDEITVNDVGMLKFIRENTDKKVNLGRLFFKDPRDFRIKEYNSSSISPLSIGNAYFYDPIDGIELDPISENLVLPDDLDLTVSVHYPYCYQTTGNICKFASIGKETGKKFRPNDICALNCQDIHEFFRYNKKGDKREVFKFGRTVYYGTKDIAFPERKPDRMIYFPLKEVYEL